MSHSSENCIFCKIINGKLPSSKVYEDNKFIAILDIAPINKGHLLVLPKDHTPDIFDIESSVLSELIVLVKRLSVAVKAGLHADGVHVLQNNGEAALQSVFHLHFHIIPKYNSDKRELSFTHPVGYRDDNDRKEVIDNITSHLK